MAPGSMGRLPLLAGTGQKTLRKINHLLKDIDRNGYQGIGKPESLSGNLAGCWSVRIDGKNRIVFRITGEQLEILQSGRNAILSFVPSDTEH